MNLLFKNTFKKIFKSVGRFLSIAFIIALGISVFIGLRESTTGMLYTADNYYDKYKLMDFKIVSTYGLTKGDVKSIEELKNVQYVIPSYSIDVISGGNSIRIHSIEKSVNNTELIDGRLPSSNNECLADFYNYKVGDKITFDKDDLSDYINIKSCKVVGTIKSVLYIRDEKGISNVGNGKLISYVFVNKDVFVTDYYTEIYVIAKNTKSMNSYYDNYTNQLKLLSDELKTLKPIRETIRYEEILKEANDKIVSINKELNSKLNKAKKELDANKKLLDSSQATLNLEDDKAESEFEEQYSSLNNNKKTIINNLNSYNITESSLNSYILSLNNNINSLKNELNSLVPGSDAYKALDDQINGYEETYDTLLTLRDNLADINSGLETLDIEYSKYEAQIKEKQLQIDSGYTEYNKGLEKLETAKKEANEKIEEAKSDLNDIEKPEWYLLDRTNNSGYLNYKEDIIKVDAIARVLPIFFILIVMLMSSNTLTRLIEEERTEIGVLLSNGYSKTNIVMSYLLYVSVAGLLGLALGLTIGYSVIPKIIYGVFLSRYYVPKLITIVSPLPFSLVIGVTILLMAVVTIVACYRELKDVPANLLRPKPPKSGKKVFLEKIGFIWNKLSFMWKITIRNLLRYKKRIIMTVLGVAGCTALLLTGMGLNDSINNISKLQYEGIFKYDSMFILGEDELNVSDNISNLFKENNVSNPLLINQSAFTYTYNNKIGDVYVIVPSDEEQFYKYINLKSTKTNKNTTLNDNGVIITEQLSEQLNVSEGDIISVRNSDKELYFLYVTDIVENYVSHYIYMNKEYYNKIFNKDISYNTILADGKIDNSVALTDYNILTVNYTDDIVGTFDNFVVGLNKIIILILVCAAILAFIVLYNLTIINVSERKREIATLKVLGFTDNEISVFVYRESFVLTILGIVFGLILGIFLHKFVILTAQTDNIMFLKDIKWLSYVLSTAVTIVFSFIVQIIINGVLKKIDMIESLKSVE